MAVASVATDFHDLGNSSSFKIMKNYENEVCSALLLNSDEELTNVKVFGHTAQRFTVVNGQVFITWKRCGNIKF